MMKTPSRCTTCSTDSQKNTIVEPEPEDDAFYPLRPYTDEALNVVHEELGVQRTILEFFLRHSEGSVPDWNASVIRQFCEENRLSTNTASPSKIIISDHEYGSDLAREHPKELNAGGLRHELAVDRFEHPILLKANRRQVLAEPLTPEAILALITEAPCHHVDTLRDAFSKHISGETSIKVQKQLDGHDRPHMEIHLPYLALRKAVKHRRTHSMADHAGKGETQDQLHVPTFLCLEGNQTSQYTIHKACMSIVIAVWDHTNWVAYGFSKACPSTNPEQLSEPDSETEAGLCEEDDDEDDEDDGDDPGPKDDIFSPDNGDLNLSVLIWNPRQYFLRMLAIWIKNICQEHTFLVMTLYKSIQIWRRENTFNAPRVPVSNSTQLNKTIKIMQLLREVREHINPAIRAWDSFMDTDMSFFDDIRGRDTMVVIGHMKSAVAKLSELDNKLVVLESFLSGEATILNLQFTRESIELGRCANDLSYKTSLISIEMQQLGRTGTDAAVANLRAAERTSWTTQINILAIWITTPAVLVLQYFGAERPIFSFERNAKSFAIAICVVFFTFPVLVYMLNSLERVREVAVVKIFGNKTKTQRPGYLDQQSCPPLAEEA